MRKVILLWAIGVILLMSYTNSITAQPDLDTVNAKEVVLKAEEKVRFTTGHTLLSMIIETRRWSRRLDLEGWYKDGTRALVKILAPPKEAGKVSLKIDGAMWNYLPNIGQAIRVHPSAMSQSWMGSDFSNDDLIRETSFVDDYSQTSEGVEDTTSGKAYRLALIPHSDASIVWGKVIYWITVEGNLPIRQEFYDEHGILIRVLTFSDFKVMDKRLIPTVWVMKRSGHEGKTTIVISEVTFDVDIPDRLFSIKEIER